jgi:hypothetical protein
MAMTIAGNRTATPRCQPGGNHDLGRLVPIKRTFAAPFVGGKSGEEQMDEYVLVAIDDVRAFVGSTSTRVPGVMVDAVVSELNARLDLVGYHPETTVLNASTVPKWIAMRVSELGAGEYDKILRANVG